MLGQINQNRKTLTTKETVKGGITINTLLCNKTNYSANRSQKIKFIVIHYTANNGDTAKGNAGYFSRTAKLGASAHYFVDENEIWQSVPDLDTAWHCGAKTYRHNECRNSNSIGIEICSRKDGNGKYYLKADAITNAIALTRTLMSKYNIDANHVLRHYDVTGKNCPAPLVDPQQWTEFKNRLEEKQMPEVPAWKKKIMDDAAKAGLIDPAAGHAPDEPATKWFVLAVGLNLLRALKGGK